MAGSSTNAMDTPKMLNEGHTGKEICVQCNAAIFNVFFVSGRHPNEPPLPGRRAVPTKAYCLDCANKAALSQRGQKSKNLACVFKWSAKTMAKMLKEFDKYIAQVMRR